MKSPFLEPEFWLESEGMEFVTSKDSGDCISKCVTRVNEVDMLHAVNEQGEEFVKPVDDWDIIVPTSIMIEITSPEDPEAMTFGELCLFLATIMRAKGHPLFASGLN